MAAPVRLRSERVLALPVIVLGAVVLRLISGVGFANYDTLYALAWGGQLARGQTPAYGVAIAPTPHPLIELLGLILYPLGPRAVEDVAVALGFLALSACGWVIYRLGAVWFGRAAGALAALLFLTRVPVLSYGVRAYVDIPYLLLVLTALLVESRRPRAGAPVLILLALAGLLRPEAWVFSGLYLIYVLRLLPWLRPAGERERWWRPDASGREVVKLSAIVCSAPLIWIVSDLLVTGRPLWSLTNTRHTASTLGRVTGIANVPEYIPRRIGEILRPPVLVGAALGGVLTLAWLRGRALKLAAAGVVAVLVFAAFASAGLPINTRYAFGASAILCLFCGAGVFGWTALDAGDRRRRWWMARRGGRGARPDPLRAGAIPLGPHGIHKTGAREHDRRGPAQARLQPRDQPEVRPGGGSQPCPDPAAGPVPEEQPREHPQRTGGAHSLRRLRRPRQHRSRKGLRARPARPASGGQRAARVHRVGLQQLMADLHEHCPAGG